MALVLYRCPKFEKCGGSARALKGSEVGHKCQWNQNKYTQFAKVDDVPRAQ